MFNPFSRLSWCADSEEFWFVFLSNSSGVLKQLKFGTGTGEENSLDTICHCLGFYFEISTIQTKFKVIEHVTIVSSVSFYFLKCHLVHCFSVCVSVCVYKSLDEWNVHDFDLVFPFFFRFYFRCPDGWRMSFGLAGMRPGRFPGNVQHLTGKVQRHDQGATGNGQPH